MNQERSEQSWDEILAALDAAGPWPDDFLSEADRDMRPPQVRPVVEALFDETEEVDSAIEELFVQERLEDQKASDARD